MKAEGSWLNVKEQKAIHDIQERRKRCTNQMVGKLI